MPRLSSARRRMKNIKAKWVTPLVIEQATRENAEKMAKAMKRKKLSHIKTKIVEPKSDRVIKRQLKDVPPIKPWSREIPKTRVSEGKKVESAYIIPRTKEGVYFGDWKRPTLTPSFRAEYKKLSKRSQKELHDKIPHALSVVMITEIGPKGKEPTHILMYRRAQKAEGGEKIHYAGLVHMPAGFVDQGKKAHKAALKEISEEVGISPRKIRFVGRGLKVLPKTKTFKLKKKKEKKEYIPPAMAFVEDPNMANPTIYYVTRINATKGEVRKSMDKAPDRWERKGKPMFIERNPKAIRKALAKQELISPEAIDVYLKELEKKGR